MQEIGSFIEIEFPTGKEYYTQEKCMEYGDVVRLNTARAAIVHAVKCYGVKKVYIPEYECDTVAEALLRSDFQVEYYKISSNFEPVIDENEPETAIVFSNYYGIFGKQHFQKFVARFHNVVIDNAQAFFAEPLKNCMNIYSVRKFVGAPDGAYCIGPGASKYYKEYDEDFSSDTSLFLLLRSEYGCEGKAYEERKKNESRISASGIKKMSRLTKRIVDGVDYEKNIRIRKNNFRFAQELFDSINELKVGNLLGEEAVPMVYPLVIEDSALLSYLQERKLFQGHWWEYLQEQCKEGTMEHWLSNYIIPITIDQRYGERDVLYQYNLVNEYLIAKKNKQ